MTGLVQKTIGDGNGGTFFAWFYDDGSGNLVPAPPPPNQLPRAPSSIVLPASALTYASGQLMANSTTAGSVTPFVIPVSLTNAGLANIGEVIVAKSGPIITNCQVRLHMFGGATAPVPAVGDGAAYQPTGALTTYLGWQDVTVTEVLTDGAYGTSGPISKGVNAGAGVKNIWGFLEARNAYARVASGETFAVSVVS